LDVEEGAAMEPPATVRVNEVDLAYVEQGQGEPIVLVHGSLNDYRSWRGQLEPFSVDHRVVAYSRRFHWPNARPAAGDVVSASQNAADLAALIERLGLAPAHVVGSSYGAMTALTLAVARPELVRALVLGEPPLLPWLARAPEGAALFDAFMADAFGPAGEAFARGDDEAGIRRFIDGVIGPGAFDRLPEPARAMMRDNAAAERAETVSPPDRYFPDLSTDDVAGLAMPVLLLEGERSPRMFHLITDELARAAAHAERVVIPAASHGMHGQNPVAYNQAVLDFIAAA
jgi:pimeloyl-ACP methyl ester carboxylesterase